MPPPGRSYPHELEAGKRFDMWIDPALPAEALQKQGFCGKIKLTAYFGDQIGRMYRSKLFFFDIDTELPLKAPLPDTTGALELIDPANERVRP